MDKTNDKASDKANLYSDFTGVFELIADDFNLKKQPKLRLPKEKVQSDYPEIIHPDFKKLGSGLIFFYAPWCGHCRQMVQPMSELAIQFKYIFPIGAINCENEANHSLCNSFKIEGFPTIFQKNADNTFSLYTGDRSKDALLKFIYQYTL